MSIYDQATGPGGFGSPTPEGDGRPGWGGRTCPLAHGLCSFPAPPGAAFLLLCPLSQRRRDTSPEAEYKVKSQAQGTALVTAHGDSHTAPSKRGFGADGDITF